MCGHLHRDIAGTMQREHDPSYCTKVHVGCDIHLAFLGVAITGQSVVTPSHQASLQPLMAWRSLSGTLSSALRGHMGTPLRALACVVSGASLAAASPFATQHAHHFTFD